MSINTQLLYRLLTRAFEQMKVENLLSDEPGLLKLATLFQDIPCRLGEAHEQQEYSNILEDLSEQARQRHLDR